MREDIDLYEGNVVLSFDPDKHRYEVTVDPLKPPLWVPSVTGITGMIDGGKSNALQGWACNLMQSEIMEKVGDIGFEGLNEVNFPDIVKNAKFARRRALESSATLGTVVHDYCEHHINYQLGLCKAPMRPRHKKAQNGVDAFLKWEAGAKPEYLFSERRIYSVAHHYAGTLDILARIGGELTVVDLKTSKNVYEEHKLQTAAYTQALNEEFAEQVTNRMILHLSKEGGTFTPHDLNREGKYNGLTFDDDLEAFLGARAVYRRLREKGKK